MVDWSNIGGVASIAGLGAGALSSIGGLFDTPTDVVGTADAGPAYNGFVVSPDLAVSPDVGTVAQNVPGTIGNTGGNFFTDIGSALGGLSKLGLQAAQIGTFFGPGPQPQSPSPGPAGPSPQPAQQGPSPGLRAGNQSAKSTGESGPPNLLIKLLLLPFKFLNALLGGR